MSRQREYFFLNQRLKFEELKEFLDEKVKKFEVPGFIENDPIQIPHGYTDPKDIEISAFLTATIAWGRREMIIKNANLMFSLMDNEPFDFVSNHSNSDLKSFEKFVHRTFNGGDLMYFILKLKKIYSNGTLEDYFIPQSNEINLKESFGRFNEMFFDNQAINFRTRKHLANPMKGSSAKRLSMFLRWMVRPNDAGVDFGIWKNVPLSKLSCPLDVHTGNVGRSLGMISRKPNDWKSVEELDGHLRALDVHDPVKYDFALFGLGVDEGWK